MSGPRTHGGDGSYNPPAIRGHQDVLLLQRHIQEKLRKQANLEAAVAENQTDSDDSKAALTKLPYPPGHRRYQEVLLQQRQLQNLLRNSAAAENRTDSDDSTAPLSKPPSVCSSSPPSPPVNVTSLDRQVETHEVKN
ncbi:hypothetical protein Acr_13g0000890 [Actinidia rufa]|uniref:Uncharacterized protein n=1 Tax=Actinidia rufa TaxID=165716 RepID=A0A7J0FJ05_9ERIC|nr:hypothetical protein Acr_13g0000890 [Actinidia rufa]